MTTLSRIAAFIVLCATPLCAQDIAGDWQGTYNGANQHVRIVLHITKTDDGGWKGVVFVIDQAIRLYANSITFDGSNLTARIALSPITIAVTLSQDQSSFDGTWTGAEKSYSLALQRATKDTAWPTDPSSHSIQFITVDKDVKLEVLDWGGTGRPLIFLTGFGDTAHVFDKFAPQFTGAYHVYGITRRGFGDSSVPASGYSADRLGDDVLAVMDALRLSKPVLVGHSLAGEELSSIGSRYPDKVSGLVYLDAGYSYAYYDSEVGDINIDMDTTYKLLDQFLHGERLQDPRPLVRKLLETLPVLERDLQQLPQGQNNNPPPSSSAPRPAPSNQPPVLRLINQGAQKYTDINVPILAIFAVPHEGLPPGPLSDALDAQNSTQAKAFEKGLPSARVVRLAHANHYVYRSNEADVIREMNAFLGTLR